MSISHAHFISIELQNKRLQLLSRRWSIGNDVNVNLVGWKYFFLLREVQKYEAILTRSLMIEILENDFFSEMQTQRCFHYGALLRQLAPHLQVCTAGAAARVSIRKQQLSYKAHALIVALKFLP